MECRQTVWILTDYDRWCDATERAWRSHSSSNVPNVNYSSLSHVASSNLAWRRGNGDSSIDQNKCFPSAELSRAVSWHDGTFRHKKTESWGKMVMKMSESASRHHLVPDERVLGFQFQLLTGWNKRLGRERESTQSVVKLRSKRFWIQREFAFFFLTRLSCHSQGHRR